MKRRIFMAGAAATALAGPAVAAGTKPLLFVPQSNLTSLDPVWTIGDQISETLRLHQQFDRKAPRAGAIALLDRVGIPSATRRVDEYPHQWSGGMLQRAVIALALAGRPRLMLADEPTTALDVTIQDQILSLLLGLQQETGMALILVSHDMGVIAETCDRVAVMYAGRIVESAPVKAIFDAPAHPYTVGLLGSMVSGEHAVGRLEPIPGQPPDLAQLGPGCAFAPRCRLPVSRPTAKLVKRSPSEVLARYEGNRFVPKDAEYLQT